MYLFGSYECKIDSKGRLMLASGLKKQLISEVNEGFILKRAVFRPCLELYPMSTWKTLVDKMSKLNRFVKKNNDFIRLFNAGVRLVELDATNRILVPKDLIAFAGIEKEIMLTASLNILEIWDRKKYEATNLEAKEEYPDLAEEVMGKLDLE